MDEQCILAKVVTPTFLYSKFSCTIKIICPKKRERERERKRKRKVKIDGLHTGVYEKTKEKTPFMASIFHLGHLQPFYEIIVMCNFTGVNSNLKGRSTSTWILPSLQILEPRKAFFLLVTPRYMLVQSQGPRPCTYTHWLLIDKCSQCPEFLHLLQFHSHYYLL